MSDRVIHFGFLSEDDGGLPSLVREWLNARGPSPEPVEPAQRRRRTGAETEATFNELAQRWSLETRTTSSLTEIIGHPAYLKIVGMGWSVVPLLLRAMERAPDHWHAALEAITQEDPVREENAGDLEAIAADWLAWGARMGLRQA